MYGLDVILSSISYLLLVICVLISVAFLTLLERSVLGYIQIRKGPNSVGIIGLPQPFGDAIKLFTKEQVYPYMSNYLIYYFSPVFSLFISLLVWCCMPYCLGFISMDLGLLFFLCCISFSVYSVMVAGWSSNSTYALLGGLRSVAQTISYEVSLSLVLMSVVFLIGGYNMMDLINYQVDVWFMFILSPLLMVWGCISLAEVNRTPFDFAEGESELVSGFNVEYGGGGFALIFLAEYASILFMSALYGLLFLGGDCFFFSFYFKLLLMGILFIWVRGTLPRFRYDKLMYLAWSGILPFSLNLLIFIIGLKMLLISLL